jgi:hypothetical protein
MVCDEVKHVSTQGGNILTIQGTLLHVMFEMPMKPSILAALTGE